VPGHIREMVPGPTVRDPGRERIGVPGPDGSASRYAGGDVGAADQVAVPGEPAPRATEGAPGGLAGQAPLAQVSVVAVPPIAGAALLGLDRAGAGPPAEERLRGAYR
jgi:hypothetical protein